jgi:predicted dehydrogenase
MSKQMNSRMNRRSFLGRLAGGGAVAAGWKAFPAPAFLADPAPNSKLQTAVIGCANQGMVSVAGAVTERLVALVDVDDNHMAQTMKAIQQNWPDVKVSEIRQFADYRKMFDQMHRQIDVVFVATPDHHHAPAAMRAIRLGKHVYVEKPLAHSIEEVRRLTEAARQAKVVTQMGNQGHSGEGLRRLCEYLQAGAIGHVREVYCWAPTGRGGLGGRPPAKPVPPGLHWDEWIGPAQYRDYHDDLHPQQWRSWWEFGDGSVGDWGCHNLDGPFTALQLGPPESVEALEQFGGSEERFPLRNVIRWNYPARDGKPPVKVYWYDGYFGTTESTAHEEDVAKQNRPPIVLELEKKYGRQLKSGGILFVGEKGILHCGNYVGSPRLIPEEAHKAFPPPPKTLPRVKPSDRPGVGVHVADFLRACKEGYQPSSNFDVAGPLTEMVLLGCLAIKAGPGKKVLWDPVQMQCPNMPELNALVRRRYRAGWEL